MFGSHDVFFSFSNKYWKWRWIWNFGKMQQGNSKLFVFIPANQVCFSWCFKSFDCKVQTESFQEMKLFHIHGMQYNISAAIIFCQITAGHKTNKFNFWKCLKKFQHWNEAEKNEKTNFQMYCSTTYFNAITFFCWYDVMGNSIMSNWKSFQILEELPNIKYPFLISFSHLHSNIWELFQFDIMLFPIISYQQKKVIVLI